LHFQPPQSEALSEALKRWKPNKLLGQGFEGSVYLVRDTYSDQKYVLKVYHNPWPKDQVRALQRYAIGVTEDSCAGLSPIELVQDSDHVLAVAYPYRRLRHLNRRLLWTVDQIGRALLGSYCRMQAYLVSRHNLALWDVPAENFMVDANGQFWLTDYGDGIAQLDGVRHLDCGSIEYGFVMLLLSISGINIRLIRQPTPGYSYDGRCLYCTELAAVASRRVWIRAIADQLRDQSASVFLDPGFYRQLGEQLPHRLAHPEFVIPTSELITSIARLRILLRRRLCS
jgi:hypothetical protein